MVRVRDKTDKYMEKVKQMEAESAQAKSNSDYKARPASYKTSLSAQLHKGKQGRSPSPSKKIVVVKQEGQRRDDENDKDGGHSKAKPSTEVNNFCLKKSC